MSEQDQATTNFSIQKIYIKDASFESPATPGIFQFNNWEPQIDLNMNSENRPINEKVWEVVMNVTATVSNDSKTAFLVEGATGWNLQY